jgi:hypothetical protein
MSKTKKNQYTIEFIDSLKEMGNNELPKQTINHIDIIDKELNKYFKFLLEKKPYNSGKKKYSDKKYSDSTWRTRQKRKKLFSKEDEDSNVSIEREINSLLNKINIDNYERLKVNIISKCKDKDLLGYTVESMFQKAVSQPGFCDIYVKLYKDLLSLEDGSKDCLVSKIISDKCDSYLDIFGEGKEKNIENDDRECNSEEDYDKLCDFLKQKEYIKGYSQFIGHLHNNEIIDISKINIFIDTIINNIENNKTKENEINTIEEYINSLYTIINCIGENFNKIEGYQNKKEIFKNYSKDSNLTSKGKFKFMDICDLLK